MITFWVISIVMFAVCIIPGLRIIKNQRAFFDEYPDENGEYYVNCLEYFFGITIYATGISTGLTMIGAAALFGPKSSVTALYCVGDLNTQLFNLIVVLTAFFLVSEAGLWFSLFLFKNAKGLISGKQKLNLTGKVELVTSVLIGTIFLAFSALMLFMSAYADLGIFLWIANVVVAGECIFVTRHFIERAAHQSFGTDARGGRANADAGKEFLKGIIAGIASVLFTIVIILRICKIF